MLGKCQKIADHGINVFINRQLIYNLPEQFFADHKIMSIEHADFDGIERCVFAQTLLCFTSAHTPSAAQQTAGLLLRQQTPPHHHYEILAHPTPTLIPITTMRCF